MQESIIFQFKKKKNVDNVYKVHVYFTILNFILNKYYYVKENRNTEDSQMFLKLIRTYEEEKDLIKEIEFDEFTYYILRDFERSLVWVAGTKDIEIYGGNGVPNTYPYNHSKYQRIRNNSYYGMSGIIHNNAVYNSLKFQEEKMKEFFTSEEIFQLLKDLFLDEDKLSLITSVNIKEKYDRICNVLFRNGTLRIFRFNSDFIYLFYRKHQKDISFNQVYHLFIKNFRYYDSTKYLHDHSLRIVRDLEKKYIEENIEDPSVKNFIINLDKLGISNLLSEEFIKKYNENSYDESFTNEITISFNSPLY